MNRIIYIFIAVILLIPFVLNAQEKEEINFLYMAQSGYQPPEIQEQASLFYKQTGIKVNISFPGYEDRHNILLNDFKEKTSYYDVVLVDLIWIKEFINSGYLEAVPDYLDKKIKNGIVPEIYSAFSDNGKLWAFPFHADFQLLYVNRNLLIESGFHYPPATLEEAAAMAESAKKAGLLKYPLFDSWKKEEALICEFTWLTGAFGGTLTDGSGNINLLTPAPLKALDFMVMLLEKGLMNPFSLQADELLTADVFISGDALFTTNWTFQGDLLSKRSKTVNFSWLPALIPVSAELSAAESINTVSVSGYEGLSVPVFSKHKKSAWNFIDFLAGPSFQYAHLNYLPVWEYLWKKEKIKSEDPYISLKELQLKGVISRPSLPDYIQVSKILQKWIYKALNMDISPAAALENAQREIDAVTERRSFK